MPNKWTRNQKLLLAGIVVSNIIAIGMLYVQVINLEKEIQPIIALNPQIINVIQNITKVEKDIANLNEMLKQQDNLKQKEIFKKSDLNFKVRKINEVKGSNLLCFDLKQIPLRNSISVSCYEGALHTGSMPPSAVVNARNIVCVKFGNAIDSILQNSDSYFWNISYLPDLQSKEKLLKVADCRKLDNGDLDCSANTK